MVRPTKQAEAEATVTLSMRVTGELKNQLDRVATASDRTMSAEAERRLRRSLDLQEALADVLDLLRAEQGLWPASARPFATAVLSELYGREVGELAVKYASRLAWARQGIRVVMEEKDHAEIDEIKGGVREIEAAHRGNAAAIASMPPAKKAR